MKKTLSIALLSFFFLHLAGFYVYFAIRQSQIHQEMRSKLKELPADQLDVLQLSITEYQRSARGDDEIQVNGKMYDIARVETKTDKVTIYCLHDSSEDNLLSFLDNVLKNATKDSQQASTSLFQFNLLSFVLPNEVISEDIPLIQDRSFTSYSEIGLSFVCTLDTPPPRG